MTNLPTCPYCGEEEPDWYLMPQVADGDSFNVECVSCDKTYAVTVSITYDFENKKLDTSADDKL